MHRSGSVSTRCWCPLSLALLLLADWTKPSRGQHIRTSRRPDGGPAAAAADEGFMTGATPRLWILTGRPTRHLLLLVILQVYHEEAARLYFLLKVSDLL